MLSTLVELPLAVVAVAMTGAAGGDGRGEARRGEQHGAGRDPKGLERPSGIAAAPQQPARQRDVTSFSRSY